MGNDYAARRAARLRNPAYRAQAGYAGAGPVYISPDGTLTVDQFDDRLDEVCITTTAASTVAARLPVAQAVELGTALLARFRPTAGILSPIELSVLIHQHQPVDVGDCRICGHKLTMASSGGGEAARYACGSDAASIMGKGDIWGAAADEAAEHRRRSEVLVSYHGDDTIIMALRELRRLRELLGEDMTVAEGEVFYPYGHGKNRCWNRMRHVGDDVWLQHSDMEFTHDPSHAELSDPEEVTA